MFTDVVLGRGRFGIEYLGPVNPQAPPHPDTVLSVSYFRYRSHSWK